MKHYPWIEFLARHGRRVAIGVATLAAAVGAYGFFRTGIPEYLVGSVLGAFAAYALVRVLAELVEVIADTLLPR